MKQVVRFETTDGLIFSTEQEAVAHEEEISISRRVGAFLTVHAGSIRTNTRLTNDLTRFLKWELEQIHTDTRNVIEQLEKEAA